MFKESPCGDSFFVYAFACKFMLDAIIPGFMPKMRGVLHEIRQNQGLSAIIPGYRPEMRGVLHESILARFASQ